MRIRWGGTGRGRGAAGLGSVVAILLAVAGWLASPVAAAAAGEAAQTPARSFEVRIERRRVPSAQRTLRATEGERVELRWTADEPVVLHLHGYDIETRVAPDKPAVTSFTARLTGRFPVAIHVDSAPGRSSSSAKSSSHHHVTLLHVEVHPR
jgi:FtsP/CotA-like multicopper oxidase with cupredoxin domain